MGAPNIQQQLYLKTALNESKDGMFDHPADLDEGYHMKSIRLARAGKHAAATLASDKAQASEMRRGGASKRTMKAHFNKGDYAAGTRAQERFDKAARKKKRKWLRAVSIKATGIAEALEQKLDEATKGSHKNVMRLDTAFLKSFNKNPRSAKTDELAAATELANKKLDAKELRRGGASERTMRRRINQDKWSEGWGAKNKFEREGQKKRRAALKAKGIAEGSLGLKSVLRKGKHNPRKYGTHMTKNAVRQLAASGRDPNDIKIYGTRGIENFGFQVNAKVKREKALKAKGLLPAPKPLSPEASASAARIGRLSRQRRGMGY